MPKRGNKKRTAVDAAVPHKGKSIFMNISPLLYHKSGDMSRFERRKNHEYIRA